MLLILCALQLNAQTESISFEGFINGSPVDLKKDPVIIHTGDTFEIKISGKAGINYSAEGFKVKYFRIADSKEGRQEMIFEKVFKRKIQLNYSKISFNMNELLIDKEFQRMEIMLNNISYWDAKEKKWISISIHPAKRTFGFFYYK